MNHRNTFQNTALALLFLGQAVSGTGRDFHVSPAGADTDPGTKEKPFATLARARDAVREVILPGLHEDVTVHLGAGVYELPRTLVFGPEDSGDEAHAVNYVADEGENVVVSGGSRITGWKEDVGGTWSATIPAAKDGAWTFRQIFVNSRRAVRARTPNAGDKQPCLRMKGAALEKDLSKYIYQFAPGQLADWRNTGDVECVVYGNWEITRKLFESVDPASGSAVMAPPHAAAHDMIKPAPNRFFHLENALEFLDEPGEWYLDRKTGVIHYRPLPGEDMTKAVVMAPRLKHLVEINGKADKPVRNIHFKGISFEHADWQPPAVGYCGIQACHFAQRKVWNETGWGMIDAAIVWSHASQCSLEDGALTRLGGCGIELAERCKDCVIRGNVIHDVSGNGVQIGGPNEEGKVPTACKVSNNHIHDCGIDYSGAVGIWVGFAEGTVVSHNLIHTLPYSGISVGWMWNPQPTACKGNTIESNHIHDVMSRLGDGGGIYTLGFQPGTVLRSNLIHDVRRSALAQAAPNNGMFIDEGSKGFLFENNVIYNASAAPVRFNQCKQEWHTWNGNILGKEAPCPGAGLEKPCAADR